MELLRVGAANWSSYGGVLLRANGTTFFLHCSRRANWFFLHLLAVWDSVRTTVVTASGEGLRVGQSVVPLRPLSSALTGGHRFHNLVDVSDKSQQKGEFQSCSYGQNLGVSGFVSHEEVLDSLSSDVRFHSVRQFEMIKVEDLSASSSLSDGKAQLDHFSFSLPPPPKKTILSLVFQT